MTSSEHDELGSILRTTCICSLCWSHTEGGNLRPVWFCCALADNLYPRAVDGSVERSVVSGRVACLVWAAAASCTDWVRRALVPAPAEDGRHQRAAAATAWSSPRRPAGRRNHARYGRTARPNRLIGRGCPEPGVGTWALAEARRASWPRLSQLVFGTGWAFVPLYRSHYRSFADHPDAQRFPRSATPAVREREAPQRLNSTPWRQACTAQSDRAAAWIAIWLQPEPGLHVVAAWIACGCSLGTPCCQPRWPNWAHPWLQHHV